MSGDVCSGCGRPIEDNPAKERQPCPECGSMARTMPVAVNITGQTAVYMKVRADHRYGGRKVLRQETSGDDFFRKTGRWSVMYRLIDRLNDWYEEWFKERDTGAIIHRKAHRLSEHQGYGSAKKEKKH